MAEPPAPQIYVSSTSPPNTAASTSSSSDSSSTATATTTSRDLDSTAIDSTNTQSTPTNDAIEAAIQAAINSSATAGPARSSSTVGSSGKGSTSDGRTIPPRDTRTQLFVGNLPYRVRWQDLKDLFRRAGTVLRADVSLGTDNRSRGFGTVLLATGEDAGRAIDMFNGYEWQTRLLEVRVDRVGGPMPEPGMQSMGAQAPVMGGVQMLSAGMYMQQQQPQGFAIPNTQFSSPQPNQAYIQSQGTSLQQQIYAPQPQPSISHFQAHLQAHAQGQSQFEQLQQQYSGQQQQSNPPSIPGRTLFVGNLPYHVQWQDLKDLFRRTPGGATVLRADVALGPDGRSKGFGTVTLRTEEETERAKRWFSGYEFNGRQLKVHHDRIPLSTTSDAGNSPAPMWSTLLSGPSYSSTSPSLLSQHAISDAHADQYRSLSSVLQSQRPISSSPSIHSSQQFAPRTSRLRSESITSQSGPGTHTSMTVQSLSSPLFRQIQAHQQETSHSMHQPAPLHSSTLPDPRSNLSPPPGGARHGGPHSRSVSSNSDLLSSTLNPGSVATSTLLGVSPQSTSPTASRSNRPTHIALPPPSFHLDFDPSIASLDMDPRSAGGYEGDREFNRGSDQSRSVSQESGSEVVQPPEMMTMRQQQQTTPLQMHFRQYLQQERMDREDAGQTELDTAKEYSPGQYQNHSQLYQLLHGSRQSSLIPGKSPKVEQKEQQLQKQDSPSQRSKSLANSSAVSAASSTTSLFEDFERSFTSSHMGGGRLRESLSSGASSAAASSKSLPLGLGSTKLPAISSSRKILTREASPADKGGAIRPLSTVSTTGSTTSESGMSTSLSGSSRTGSSAPTGHGAVSQTGSPSKGGGSRLQEIERQERTSHPHHPGSITLPPPPQVVFPLSNAPQQQQGGVGVPLGSSDVVKLGKGLFQQHHPFASRDSRITDDSAEFEFSGAPTLQARPQLQQQQTQFYSSSDRGEMASQRRGAKESARNQEVQQWNDAQFRQYFSSQHMMQMQLTPHGLPVMTPSMPPFNLQAPFHSPGVYPTLVPMGAGGTSHFQQRQRQPGMTATVANNNNNRSRQHPNAPGTLSLPPQQLVFVPGHHHQSPILSPASTIGPGTAMPYLHPLGSPGSPYALGPHHPLNLHHAQQQQQHMYHHGHIPMPHPLSHSFGSAAGAAGHVPAMSPGAPWGRPGMMAYGEPAAVSARRRSGGAAGERREGSRSRSVGQDAAQKEQQLHQQHWMYRMPDITPAEPKGYFDQVYMGSSEYSGGSGGGGEFEKTAESSISAVEREILKDKGAAVEIGSSESVEVEEKEGDGEGTSSISPSTSSSSYPPAPPLLESRSSESTKSSIDRESWRSTSVGSPETMFTTDEEGVLERLSSVELGARKSPSPPDFQHANTDPTPGINRAKAVDVALARRSTGGEED